MTCETLLVCSWVKSRSKLSDCLNDLSIKSNTCWNHSSTRVSVLFSRSSAWVNDDHTSRFCSVGRVHELVMIIRLKWYSFIRGIGYFLHRSTQHLYSLTNITAKGCTCSFYTVFGETSEKNPSEQLGMGENTVVSMFIELRILPWLICIVCSLHRFNEWVHYLTFSVRHQCLWWRWWHVGLWKGTAKKTFRPP